MEDELVKRLTELNRSFYSEFAANFDETRRGERFNLAPIMPYLPSRGKLLDVGCGNGRLAERLDREGYALDYVGIDFTPPLLESARRHATGFHHVRARFVTADLTSASWAAALDGDAPFDLILALAVLHHIPDESRRRAVLCDLRGRVATGGRIVVSNWQFVNSERLLKKIVPWSVLDIDESRLDPGDTLLDWRRGGLGYRYVHLFSDKDIADLAQKCQLRVVDQFLADGQLNLYSILSSG